MTIQRRPVKAHVLLKSRAIPPLLRAVQGRPTAAHEAIYLRVPNTVHPLLFETKQARGFGACGPAIRASDQPVGIAAILPTFPRFVRRPRSEAVIAPLLADKRPSEATLAASRSVPEGTAAGSLKVGRDACRSPREF